VEALLPLKGARTWKKQALHRPTAAAHWRRRARSAYLRSASARRLSRVAKLLFGEGGNRDFARPSSTRPQLSASTDYPEVARRAIYLTCLRNGGHRHTLLLYGGEVWPLPSTSASNQTSYSLHCFAATSAVGVVTRLTPHHLQRLQLRRTITAPTRGRYAGRDAVPGAASPSTSRRWDLEQAGGGDRQTRDDDNAGDSSRATHVTNGMNGNGNRWRDRQKRYESTASAARASMTALYR